MKIKTLIAGALCALTAIPASAVATNYALHLDAGTTVDCGEMPRLAGASSYTLQFFMKPAKWSAGAAVLSFGDNLAVSLGNEGSINLTVAGTAHPFSSSDLKAGAWTQITAVVRNGNANVLINGTSAGTVQVGSLPAAVADDKFVMGGQYDGLLDEVRVWDTFVVPTFNYFINNTINRWNLQADNLLAYYKFDQAGCSQVVDYTALWNPDAEYNNHGTLSAGAARHEAVTDNAALPYLVNGAYTANERFFDRAIPRDQYLLANDLIILGIESETSGHLHYATPNNHATNHGAEYKAAYEGRSGVAHFGGTATIEAPEAVLTGSSFTFSAWVYVDEWTEGATIFGKENSDATKGFALVLGDTEKQSLVARINGKQYVFNGYLKPSAWTHIAVCPNAIAQYFYQSANLYVNGDKVNPTYADCDTELDNTPDFTAATAATLGSGFKGAIDEAFVTSATLSGTDITSIYKNGVPMPGFDKAVSAEQMNASLAYYTFDRPDNLGYSSHSQDEWLAIMKSAYEGHSGYEIRISVKSHNGWENTIANANRRKIFAQDLAALSGPYDGVELDLEWIYGTQTNLGLLAEEIRKALPEGKSLMISCHNVAYSFPKDKMNFVDGFTFQQYGPQKVHFGFNHFKNMLGTFVNYGFDKAKIIGSYATTTSKGFKGETIQQDKQIMGVRNANFLGGDSYTPDQSADTESRNVGGCDYYFTGPWQVYHRAEYIRDNGMGGIFYWDMGNDVAPSNDYSLARWCAYGLNSNVEPAVTVVEVKHHSGLAEASVGAKATGLTVRVEDNIALVNATGEATVSALDGRTLLCAPTEGSVDVSNIRAGIYIMTVAQANGHAVSTKFLK